MDIGASGPEPERRAGERVKTRAQEVRKASSRLSDVIRLVSEPRTTGIVGKSAKRTTRSAKSKAQGAKREAQSAKRAARSATRKAQSAELNAHRGTASLCVGCHRAEQAVDTPQDEPLYKFRSLGT